MTLSSVFNIATSSLATNAERAAIVSRNIANADDPSASRKTAMLATGAGGAAEVAAIVRDVDLALVALARSSNANNERLQSISSALNQLDAVIGDPAGVLSPSSQLAAFRDSLMVYAATPYDESAGRSALNAALSLASGLSAAANAVHDVRERADQELRGSVDRINTILADFEGLNAQIVTRTPNGDDITDLLDQRDRLITELGGLIGVRTLTREDNDTVILTENSLTLFETSARIVTMDDTPVLNTSSTGATIYVDGMAVTGAAAGLGPINGKVAGLIAIRDDIAPKAQAQLDEMARALVINFRETDQTGGGAPDQPGLFTATGLTSVPSIGTAVPGLASRILVNPAVDPNSGGSVSRLRDGAITGPGNTSYLYNTGANASFGDRLNELVDSFSTDVSFDLSAGISTNVDVMSFAANSVAWLQEARNITDRDAQQSQATYDRATVSLSNAAGSQHG